MDQRRGIMRKMPLKKPGALVCGMLDDDGRVLFLIRRNDRGMEQLEMPCIETFSSVNVVDELATEFKRQTGIDGEVHEVAFQSRYNAGSRKRRYFVPVLVFRVTAKNRTAKPSNEFAGFRWFSLDNAKLQRLCRKLEWLKK